jgi:hypothetical protein
MALPLKTEHALMKRDEIEILSQTHHPAILDAEDKSLTDVRLRIRSLLDKERSLVRSMRRSIRGKADARGGSFPGDVEKPAQRKQVLAGALKRLNKELSRRRAVEAREATRNAARRALALKDASGAGGAPRGGRTASEGMRSVENTKRRTSVNRDKVGSVSQRTKKAQAAKDAR